VHGRTAQQELVAEAQATGLETRGRRQEAQSGSERVNEGQGGQKEMSQHDSILHQEVTLPYCSSTHPELISSEQPNIVRPSVIFISASRPMAF
jgi:hypothetical protein